MIAFLGMGHLGANFVKALLKKRYTLKVWSRTHAKAEALASLGAQSCESVEDAVRDCKRIHLTLKDDAAVDEVLAQAEAGFMEGVTIFDHTTTSVAGAIRRTNFWASKGFTYIHVPVFMGPQNALESTGAMLISGEQTLIAQWYPFLADMTGKLLNLGSQIGKAAAMKLTGNLLLVGITASLADALAHANATGVSPEELAGLLNNWNPGALLNARLTKITSNTFDKPTWELEMARKDVGLMMNEANAAKMPLHIIPTIAALMDNYIAEGLGQQDWTIIAKDSLK